MICCSRLGHTPQPPSSPISADNDEFGAVRLEDIEVIATLGMGGFGRVELVSFTDINPLKDRAVNWLHLAIQV